MERVYTLACKPVINRTREMKPGQVARERGDLLTMLQDAYGPFVSRAGSLEGLQDIIDAFIHVLLAGDKKSGVSPKQVRAAIDLIKSKQSTLAVARVWLGSAAGRQMIADAELCTKKTAGDNTGDLLLKKSIEHEAAILKLIPQNELECMEDADHDLGFLTNHVSLAQCVELLQTVLVMLTKLLEATKKWSPMGLEEQSSTLASHHGVLFQCMLAVQHRVAHCIYAACSPKLLALKDENPTNPGDSCQQELQVLAAAATAADTEITGAKVTDNYRAVVKAMVVYFNAAKESDLAKKAELLGAQYQHITSLLSLASAAADLGMITELPELEEAVKEWGDETEGKLPYMQRVSNFVTLCLGVREFDMTSTSRVAQNMQKEFSDHPFLLGLQQRHATSRISAIMLSLRQNLCHGMCQLEVRAKVQEKVAKLATETLDNLATILFNDPQTVSCLAKKAQNSFSKAPSVKLTGAAHEGAVDVATLAISALGPLMLPADAFDGIWDGAVEGGHSQKALELSRLHATTTSLAFCLSFALDFCQQDSSILVPVEGSPNEERADTRCFVALQSACLMVKHLRGEVGAKVHFYPTEQQTELNGILGFCDLAEAAATRLIGALTFSAQTHFGRLSEDMANACPNWMPLITPKTLNMAASKRMLLDGDAIAGVSAAIRKFGSFRAVVDDAFQMLGVDFASANHGLYETGVDNEIHARLTVALKAAVQIIANQSKNPKCNVLVSEFQALITKQNNAIAKLKTQVAAKTKKVIVLPGSVKEALDNLASSCKAPKGSAKAASSGGGKRAVSSAGASASSAAGSVKRPRRS